jgi:hypothetical protein
MFADLFPTRRGRPSVPAAVMASVITFQALHGLSDNETLDAVTFDLRRKAACGLPITAMARSSKVPPWAAPEGFRHLVIFRFILRSLDLR